MLCTAPARGGGARTATETEAAAVVVACSNSTKQLHDESEMAQELNVAYARHEFVGDYQVWTDPVLQAQLGQH